MVFAFSYKKIKRFIFIIVSSLISWLILTAVNVYLTNSSQTLYLIDNSISISLPVNFKPETELAAVNYVEKDVPDKGISFKYPSAFRIKEYSFEGGEIIYHLNFTGKTNDINGYIQIWNMKMSLNEFLQHAKSDFSTNIFDFQEEKVNINNLSGYKWSYKIKTNQGIIEVRQVFLEKDNKMYVISLFVPVNKFNIEYENIFNEMVDSLHVKSVT